MFTGQKMGVQFATVICVLATLLNIAGTSNTTNCNCKEAHVDDNQMTRSGFNYGFIGNGAKIWRRTSSWYRSKIGELEGRNTWDRALRTLQPLVWLCLMITRPESLVKAKQRSFEGTDHILVKDNLMLLRGHASLHLFNFDRLIVVFFLICKPGGLFLKVGAMIYNRICHSCPLGWRQLVRSITWLKHTITSFACLSTSIYILPVI